jgi:hypothetical protein
MKIKKNAFSTLVLDFFATPNQLLEIENLFLNPKIDSPYCVVCKP